MRFTRLALVTVLPVVVLLLGLLMVKGGAPVVADSAPVVAMDSLPMPQATPPSWPPVDKKLVYGPADSTAADVESVRLATGVKVIVAVWMEGLSDHEIAGSIKMRWRFEDGDTWRIASSQAFPLADSRYVYGYPSLALYPVDSTTLQAHVVYLRTDQVNSVTEVRYQVCTLDASGESCTGGEGVNSGSSSQAPKIDVDDAGNPHVVWAEYVGDPMFMDIIRYNNKVGDVWGEPWLSYEPGKSPAVVVWGAPPEGMCAGEGMAFVSWDREVNTSQAGILVARRDCLDAMQTGSAEEDKWQVSPISSPPAGIPSAWEKQIVDGYPSMAIGENSQGVYVAWHRLVASQEIASPYCYQYRIAYRVHPLSGDIGSGWLPGSTYANPYTVTTFVPAGLFGGVEDLYSGARPVIQATTFGADDLVSLAWQQSAASSCSAGSLDVSASADESDVNDYPLSVRYAFVNYDSSLARVGAWASQVVTVNAKTSGFLANPDLSLLPGDTSTLTSAPLHPHVVMLERFPTMYGFYGWDVWYVNDDPDDEQWIEEDPFVYLPAVMKKYY